MAANRHLSRIAVIQTLFAYEAHGGDQVVLLEYVLKEFHPQISEPIFAKSNLEGVFKNREKIKELIGATAPEWPFEKIAPIDRVILEQGVYEIVFSSDVPPVVAINEAIEVAKEFGNENSPKFINGVLSTVMKNHNQTKNDGPF